jgi:hypothetical protein
MGRLLPTVPVPEQHAPSRTRRMPQSRGVPRHPLRRRHLDGRLIEVQQPLERGVQQRRLSDGSEIAIASGARADEIIAARGHAYTFAYFSPSDQPLSREASRIFFATSHARRAVCREPFCRKSDVSFTASLIFAMAELAATYARTLGARRGYFSRCPIVSESKVEPRLTQTLGSKHF